MTARDRRSRPRVPSSAAELPVCNLERTSAAATAPFGQFFTAKTTVPSIVERPSYRQRIDLVDIFVPRRPPADRETPQRNEARRLHLKDG